MTHVDTKDIREWAAALVSGEFKQGHGLLRGKDDTYCCLGVKCELVRRKEPEKFAWNLEGVQDGYDFVFPDEDFVGAPMTRDLAYAPSFLMRRVGLQNYGQRLDRHIYEVGDGYESLSSMNDDGRSFHEIADVLVRYADEMDAKQATEGATL